MEKVIYINKKRQLERKKLESQFRKYWLPILHNSELNIFHLEKYNRDLLKLKNT